MFRRMFIEIFDDGPVSAGLEGPAPDPAQVILDEELRRLYKEYGAGVTVRRYDLGTNPRDYLDHPPVARLLREYGPPVLPVTIVNGVVVKTGSYPMYGELQLPEEELEPILAWERVLGARF